MRKRRARPSLLGVGVTMNKDVLFEFNNFGYKYNSQSKPTLYDINLKIHRGEKVLIAGVSGCGKSTLVHCMNGLIPFSYKGEITGELKLLGENTKDMSLFKISEHVGTVLQDSDAQFVGLTVAEDIAFALENDCVGEPELHKRVLEAARIVNVDDYLKHAPRELSGGQKQRVSVAGVMVDNVDCFIFDEPLANLDPATGKQAVELIDDVAKDTGAAVVIIEHRIEDVLHRPVDRIVLMNEGRIIADMSSDEILSCDIFKNAGIREPLYVSALKYSKVDVVPEKMPSSIETVIVDDNDAEKVRNWFGKNQAVDNKRNSDVLLSIKDLRFKYEKSERYAVDGVSLDIYKGEMVAIVGTNGAGKSTFTKLLCGLEEKNSGSIMFAGSDFSKLSIKERAEHVGYCMQNPNQMISKVMIYDEVAFGLRCRNVPEDQVDAKVGEVLKICGLWKFRNWPISALSFGQKKRVTIASILVLDPEIIVLDEPTAGQDYSHYTEIMDFLLELNAKGITIVMITHDMHLMLEYARRAVVFSNGKIICDDTCSNVLTDDSIIKAANLKETSLYSLALKCQIDNPRFFVQSFIEYERMNERGIEA